MDTAGSTRRMGAPAFRTLPGWTLATTIVVVAVIGPPLTGQRVHALIELRQDVLMIDREVERWSVRARLSRVSDKARKTLGSAA
jgi:hypothetical protein